MKTIYLFPGLGADGRIFSAYQFPGLVKKVMEWHVPNKNENLHSYVGRFKNQITEEAPILLGVSFGGMIASEIAKSIPNSSLILISSVHSSDEMPRVYKLAGKLQLTKILPARLLLIPNPFIYWVFGAHTHEIKTLLKSILRDTSPQFLKWAIHSIAIWGGKNQHKNKIQIHGTNDKILPPPHEYHAINNGGHLMVITHQIEIEKLIINWLNRNSET